MEELKKRTSPEQCRRIADLIEMVLACGKRPKGRARLGSPQVPQKLGEHGGVLAGVCEQDAECAIRGR